EACGCSPIAYMMSRSLRPRRRPEPGDIDAASRVLASLPPGMDLLLPGSARDLGDTLVGYRPDLMVVFGFNWRLPREVLDLPRFGVLNVHQSALPRYRGPAPVLWAIRNGDPTIGVTVHRMDEGFDTGPVMEQVDDVPLPEDATPASVWERTGQWRPAEWCMTGLCDGRGVDVKAAIA
ncbi:MAG: methionyl-tRNA formyltransferase, partial [Myxococcales bacterium]